jgi:hypothetical protein
LWASEVDAQLPVFCGSFSNLSRVSQWTGGRQGCKFQPHTEARRECTFILGEIDRFSDVARGPDGVRIADIGGVLGSAKHNAWNRAQIGVGLDGCQHVQSADAREVQVEQDEIGPARALVWLGSSQERKGLLAIGDMEESAARTGLQADCTEELCGRGVVFNQEDVEYAASVHASI